MKIIDWHKERIEWFKKKTGCSTYGVYWISFIKGIMIGAVIMLLTGCGTAPAVVAMITMPLTYSISNGIALAFIAYALIKILTGKFTKTSPAIWVIAILSVLSFYVA